MRCNTFARSAVFAALAATAWFAWVVALGPLIGVGNARAVFLIGTAALYVAGLSGGPLARRIGAAIAVVAAATALALAVRTTAELAIGLAVVLGIARSGVLYRAATARAVVSEVALLGGGLLFARFLAGPSLAATALALWGFLLVQSFFFLIPGVRAQPARGRQADPFEEAHQRALSLLERRGV